MAEKWTENEDKTAAIVTGRVRNPHTFKKLYPLVMLIVIILALIFYLSLWWLPLLLVPFFCTWWVKNDDEPMAGPEYLAGYPYWLRVAGWYLRNPLQNFGKYVMGVHDRNYTVYGTAPVMWITAWNDLPDWTFENGRRGWKFSMIHIGWLRLPFVSYVGKKVMWYFGWAWWGFFGAKWNKLNSSFQVV